MRVTFVNSTDIRGGAARAAIRQWQALAQQPVTCTYLCQSKFSDIAAIQGPINKLRRGWSFIRPTLDTAPAMLYPKWNRELFSCGYLPSPTLLQAILRSKPDVVHLHWIAGATLSVRDLKKIDCPIVWTLHDEWAYTGGCHTTYNCTKFQDNCGRCPTLGSSRERDLSRLIIRNKIQHYPEMTIVGPSNWIVERSKQSHAFSLYPHSVIPNALDLEIYKPTNRRFARSVLNLEAETTTLLFGSLNPQSDPRKGLKQLIEALKANKFRNANLVVFGTHGPIPKLDAQIRTTYMGKVNDDYTLSLLYNAADATLVPSLIESFGQTASESLACGTPVVAFDTSGLKDIVTHRETGFLATCYDAADYALGIEWVLKQGATEEMRDRCHHSASERFSYQQISRQLHELYQSVVKK